jgi:hypothetical protein
MLLTVLRMGRLLNWNFFLGKKQMKYKPGGLDAILQWTADDNYRHGELGAVQ